MPAMSPDLPARGGSLTADGKPRVAGREGTTALSQPSSGWRHFPHQADVGLSGFGPTLEDAFEQTALAMTAVVTEPAAVQPTNAVTVECTAPDIELLLIEWLNALIYEMATRNMLFGSFDVHIDGTRLDATARGEEISAERHEPAVELKGATYTALSVRQGDDGLWTTTCVVDV